MEFAIIKHYSENSSYLAGKNTNISSLCLYLSLYKCMYICTFFKRGANIAYKTEPSVSQLIDINGLMKKVDLPEWRKDDLWSWKTTNAIKKSYVQHRKEHNWT